MSRSLATFDHDRTLIAVIEMSQSSWLVAGIVPGIERHPLKKLAVDEEALLRLVQRWQDEAAQAGRKIERIAVAFEAGRDGFWLARWLRARNIEAYVIHPTSVAVSREHRRAKTDRLDTELLKRAFLGWLRGEPDHCSMAAIPTMEEEDAKRPHRERESLVAERTRIVNRMKGCLARLGIRTFKPTLQRATDLLPTLRTPEGTPLPPNALAEMSRDLARLRFVEDQIREIEAARLERLNQAPDERSHAMVRLLARIIGVGIETADMLVREVLSRNLRDRRAVARYAGLTGAPDESGSKRREKGLARAGNARVRRAMSVAFPHVPEGKCSCAVVPRPDGRWPPRHAEITDRRHGAQAADPIMALRDDRPSAGWRRDAAGLSRREHNSFGGGTSKGRRQPMTI